MLLRSSIAGAATLFLLSASRRRPFEKICSFDTERVGKTVHDIDAGGVNASLKRTDIGPVDSRSMRESFLRQMPRLPQLSEVERQNLSDLHFREGIDLKSISPRSTKMGVGRQIDAERGAHRRGCRFNPCL